jgi:hypothetical protein
MSDALRHVNVEPRDHSPECRRGLDPASRHFGVDTERCERCRNLWAALEAVAEARKAGATA